MTAGHHRHLDVEGSSLLHRMPPQCKIAASVTFVFAVVAMRRDAVWAFGIAAALLVAVAISARLPLLTLAGRLVIGLPFMAFAVALPFLAGGERTDIGPFSVSEGGLWAAWNIVAKGTLGLAASVVLTAVTTLPDLLRGLERLHLPTAMIAVLTFMVRYLDVITGEMRRMRIARVSRGHDPRWLWQVGADARAAGVLFVRAFERGERVHLAMLSRGYAGTFPRLGREAATSRDWAVALTLPAAATAVAVASWTLT